MEFVLLYFALWLSAIAWFAIFSVYHHISVRNAGFAFMTIGAGMALVGFVSIGLNANIGPFILLVLAGGMATLTLPMLAIEKYFRSGKFCKRFGHKRWANCKCQRCGEYLGHVWIKFKEENCFAKCSACGYKRKNDEHTWMFMGQHLGTERCTTCGMERKVPVNIRIDGAGGHCEKSEDGHCISGCFCEHCGAIIIEGNHDWDCVKHDSHDGTGDARYKCKKCGLKRYESWNPYNEKTAYDHDRAVKE